MTAKLLPNSVVMSGATPEAVTISAYYMQRVGQSPEAVHIFTTADDDTALVLKPEHAAPYAPLMKAAEFQAVHKGTASPETKAKVLAAYGGMDEESFKSQMRTVGCGTNIYINCADGLHQLVVQRTAPNTTPEGVVHAGAYTRAAGSCTGDIQRDQVRECIEEPHIFIRGANGLVLSVDICRADRPISVAEETSFLVDKQKGVNEVFAQVQDKFPDGTVMERQIIAATPIIVPGLSETVLQMFSNPAIAPKAFRSVVVDDPKSGDVNGVDAIIHIDLPNVHSRDIFVADGERNFEGKPLARKWQLMRPEVLEAAQRDGSMKFSPAPGKVIENTAKVVQAITTLKL